MDVTISRPQIGSTRSAILVARREMLQADCRIQELSATAARATGLPLLCRGPEALSWASDVSVVALGDRVDVKARFRGARRARVVVIAPFAWLLLRVAVFHPDHYAATKEGLAAWITAGLLTLSVGAFGSWLFTVHLPQSAIVHLAEKAAAGDAPVTEALDRLRHRDQVTMGVLVILIFLLVPLLAGIRLGGIVQDAMRRAGHPLTTAQTACVSVSIGALVLAVILAGGARTRRSQSDS